MKVEINGRIQIMNRNLITIEMITIKVFFLFNLEHSYHYKHSNSNRNYHNSHDKLSPKDSSERYEKYFSEDDNSKEKKNSFNNNKNNSFTANSYSKTNDDESTTFTSN